MLFPTQTSPALGNFLAAALKSRQTLCFAVSGVIYCSLPGWSPLSEPYAQTMCLLSDGLWIPRSAGFRTSHHSIAELGGGGCVFGFGVRFVVGVPQKEGGHVGSGESGGLQPAAALGGRRHQPPRELRETLGKHSVITGEKS